MQPDEDDAPETPPERPKSSKFWQTQLAMADRHSKDWLDRAKVILKRYKNERASATGKARRGKSFSILYANTETYKAALYGRQAKPDVRRRHQDGDKRLQRIAGEMIERVLAYQLDDDNSEDAFKMGVFDYALAGRGIIRVDYEPKIGKVMEPDMMGNLIEQEAIVDQVIRDVHIAYDDFRHSPAKAWQDVWWIAFRHRMTREDLKENNFDRAEDIPLDWSPASDEQSGPDKLPDDIKRAEVWEVWDSRSKERHWISKSHDKVLRSDDDPYKLERFWPLAQPLTWGATTDDWMPTPDFDQYEDQANDLDECTARISNLTASMKRRGTYDETIKELARLAKAGDNQFIPVKNYAAFAQGGGLQGSFQVEDISPLAVVLTELYRQRDALVQGIYETTGISDIMRGATNPNETATAQKLKAETGSNRIKGKQKDVQNWVRNHLRLKAEIIAEHFEPEVLMQISGMQVQPEEMAQIVQMLRDDKLRGYAIDIETDSTVFEDATQEKQDRIEVLTSMGAFLREAVPAVQASPPLGPLMFEMLSFGIRAFKAGRSLEDQIDETKQQVMQMLQQQMANPKPSPEEMKLQGEQMKIEGQMQVAQTKANLDQQKAQAELAQQQAQLEFEKQMHQMKLQIEQLKLMVMQQKAEIDAQTAQREMAMQEREFAYEGAAQERQFEHETATMDRQFEQQSRMDEQKLAAAKQAAKAKANGRPRAN